MHDNINLFDLQLQPNSQAAKLACAALQSLVDKVVVRLFVPPTASKVWNSLPGLLGAINTQIIFQSRASACTSQSIKNRLLTTFHVLIVVFVLFEGDSDELEPVCCEKQQKKFLTSFWFVEQGNSEDSKWYKHQDSYTIRLESFRSFRGPLYRKPVTGQELFLLFLTANRLQRYLA